ncbi:MAG: SPFH domain-containing protein [Oscillospiraceae bacterium]|nr:SPFH domain-containing protein [Oscillospiraceae bacterium]
MSEIKRQSNEEVILKAKKGMVALVLNILAMIAGSGAFGRGIFLAVNGDHALGGALIAAGAIYTFIIGPLIFIGLKVVRPNEALVLTLFGRYFGTLRSEGFFWVNPFCTAVNPAAGEVNPATAAPVKTSLSTIDISGINLGTGANKKISLKAMTLSNDRQKINDQMGNPIIIGTVVIWKVVNTAKAVFNVDNYKEFLSIQCDAALRNIVSQYPYDSVGSDNEKSLRGSSVEVVEKLKNEIQAKAEVAGLEILEARITHLSYAEEIASAMLQRQQASAVVDAKQAIVEGAVGMVEMALEKLSANDIVHLDEERKAAMVSNLLVVLCGSRDVQPVVNSGSLY